MEQEELQAFQTLGSKRRTAELNLRVSQCERALQRAKSTGSVAVRSSTSYLSRARFNLQEAKIVPSRYFSEATDFDVNAHRPNPRVVATSQAATDRIVQRLRDEVDSLRIELDELRESVANQK
jgi:hypothetical protein